MSARPTPALTAVDGGATPGAALLARLAAVEQRAAALADALAATVPGRALSADEAQTRAGDMVTLLAGLLSGDGQRAVLDLTWYARTLAQPLGGLLYDLRRRELALGVRDNAVAERERLRGHIAALAETVAAGMEGTDA